MVPSAHLASRAGSVILTGSTSRSIGPELKRQLDLLSACRPSDRIGLRDEILVYGIACIEPLASLVDQQPGLAASVSAWLELLAGRDETANPVARTALKRLAGRSGGSIAQQALDRLKGADHPVAGRGRASRAKDRVVRDHGAEVHSRLVAAARQGHTLTYTELETSRGHVGTYLRKIVQAEADADHPPLTAIVVSKTTGRPGDGFLPAMLEIGFAQPGEDLEAVWQRAVRAVHDFWRDKP